MNRLQELDQAGQSVWLDYIERNMIQDGRLQALLDQGVLGVTSNPSIFEKAITGSSAYTADIQRFAAQGMGPKAIFEALAVADIQAAADVLRPVYARTQGVDGYVSIEVAPDLAYDEEQTVAEALRLHAAVDRPNILIKVPATAPGVNAIERLIAAGLSINVTLIFSLERYAAVKEAYLRGLEQRVKAGQAVDHISSVASFFISRVDSNVDARLQTLIKL
ncbi:MAG: transaldolase, partial [Caldilineaceae bacterium]|nr:transaldolase [Caldilineaceae bacterium]MBP9074942.1 transaldolase [Caldilineaceae bacterium]